MSRRPAVDGSWEHAISVNRRLATIGDRLSQLFVTTRCYYDNKDEPLNRNTLGYINIPMMLEDPERRFACLPFAFPVNVMEAIQTYLLASAMAWKLLQENNPSSTSNLRYALGRRMQIALLQLQEETDELTKQLKPVAAPVPVPNKKKSKKKCWASDS